MCLRRGAFADRRELTEGQRGTGAAIGAVVTEKSERNCSLAIAVALLAIVLLRCEQNPFANG
jgi:hypothetical protein